MVVGVFEAAFLRPCDGRAERGEEDDVVRVLLENVFRAFLDKARHFCSVVISPDDLSSYDVVPGYTGKSV